MNLYNTRRWRNFRASYLKRHPLCAILYGLVVNLYNTRRWRNFRATYLKRHPLCAMCQKLGRITEATVVDHIEPHRGDVNKFWSGPFQPLCKKCHDRHKQAEERGGVAMGCDENGYPLSQGHWWSKK